MTRIQTYSMQGMRRINAAVKRLEGEPIVGHRERALGSIPADRLRVLNESGGDLELGYVSEFKDSIMPPDTQLADFRDYVGMRVITPTATVGDSWGIVTNFIGDEEVGPLAIDGVQLAQVNVTDAGHTHANPVNGQSILQSATAGGAEILAIEPGVGTKWAYVWLDRSTPGEAASANFTADGVMATGGAYHDLGLGRLTHASMQLDIDNNISISEAGIYSVNLMANVLPWSGAHGGDQNTTFESLFSLRIQRRTASPGAIVHTVVDQAHHITYSWDPTVNANAAGQGTIIAPQFALGASNSTQMNAGEVLALYVDAEFAHSFNDDAVGETVITVRRAG